MNTSVIDPILANFAPQVYPEPKQSHHIRARPDWVVVKKIPGAAMIGSLHVPTKDNQPIGKVVSSGSEYVKAGQAVVYNMRQQVKFEWMGEEFIGLEAVAIVAVLGDLE